VWVRVTICAAATTVQVTAPAGGTLQAGQQVAVQWQTNGPVSSHSVRLSYDGGEFQNVTQADLSGGARNFSFPLPAPPKQLSQAVIRVAAKDTSGAQVGRGDSAPFAVQRVQPPPQPRDPVVTSITPAEGATSGGRSVTVKGDNFAQGASLFIGGNPAQEVRVVDARTITAKTPARNTAGQVNVRVQNPDTKEATLPQGFSYTDAPVINEVAPNTGPISTDGTRVLIRGLFFKPGVQVFFKDSPAAVLSLKSDGTEIEVSAPRSDTPGAVRVRVLNADEGEARKPDGFTYLGPRQQQRARIRKATPTAFLEGDEVTVVVTGSNLHASVGNVFGPRTSAALNLEQSRVTLGFDAETGEETVSFKLRVTLAGGGQLDPLQRGIIEVIASTRPQARVDGLVETFATLTVLPRATPVTISFTASVMKGKTSVVAVAGMNLKNTLLEMDGPEGVSLEHQFSDDNLAVALISVAPTTADAPLSVRLVDKNSPGSAPRTLPLRVKAPGGAANPARVAGEDDPDIAVSEFEAVPGQNLLAPTEEDSIAYNLTTSGNVTTFSGVPDTRLANLVVGAEFTIARLSFDIPLFTYARPLSLFDKGGTQVTQRDLVLRLGTIRSIRALTLMLVADIRLRVEVRVNVIVGRNPFADFNSPQPFLGQFEGAPGLPSNAFGAVVLGFRVLVD
ncbi:MAG TPA: IPT/TIG domain-containing protein, partial [Pyrinomonadaceae bacterium]|nr:IPT/TIG domain-containing protein [Pyrinomonadaceae bacterium]